MVAFVNVWKQGGRKKIGCLGLTGIAQQRMKRDHWNPSKGRGGWWVETNGTEDGANVVYRIAEQQLAEQLERNPVDLENIAAQEPGGSQPF